MWVDNPLPLSRPVHTGEMEYEEVTVSPEGVAMETFPNPAYGKTIHKAIQTPALTQSFCVET